MQLVESGPFDPRRWPSIALASAELRRPRHLHAIRGGADAESSGRGTASDARASVPSRRR
jgi:hypothetical protein